MEQLSRPGWSRLAVLVATIATLSACSSVREIPSLAGPASIVSPTCPRDATRLGLTRDGDYNGGGTVPAGFESESVIWCFIEAIGPAVQEDTASFDYAHREAGTSPDLLAALRANDLADRNATCSADEPGPVFLLLVDRSRRAAHVRLPEDQCGKYRPETMAALNTLDFDTKETFEVLVSRRDAR